MNAKLEVAVLCVLASCGSGCLSDPVCPPFATIVGGDFGYLGDTRWWTLEVEQIPATFTLNQPEVPANFLEYRWAVDIDSDGDGAIDRRASIDHFATAGAAPLTTGDILSATNHRLLEVMGGMASEIGSIDASLTDNTFRFQVTTAAAASLATVTDRAQSIWKTAYRSSADVDEQCDDQWP